MITQVMTTPERLVHEWLTRNGIPFQFQTSLAGGFYEMGGSVVDFLLTEYNVALRVQGVYWHEGLSKRASDLVHKEILESQGLTVIDIWEDDIHNRLEQVMRSALEGIELPRGG